MIKVKVIRKTGSLEVTKTSSEPLIFSKDEVLGVVDLSIGYYKVNQSMILCHLQPCYVFKPVKLCED